MPNYVKNRLYISGETDEVNNILDKIKGENRAIDFEKIIPMPNYIYRGGLGQKEKDLYGKNNWYDWSVENWGTKWNAIGGFAEVLYQNDSGYTEVCLEIYTAWSPPCPL